VLITVGRVHQLFPALEALRPATLTGVAAIVLYLLDRREVRWSSHVFVGPTKYLLLLLCWMMLSTAGALVQGRSFELVFDNFIKTVLMYFIVAGSVRGIRDVERLMTVYLAAAALYAVVVLSRFELGEGDAWRLGRLYYYDANDFATFIVTAMPFGLYLLHAARGALTRTFAATALIVLTLAFVRTGSRGGFVALAVVGCYVVLRYTAIALRWRLAAAALVGLVFVATASDHYWKQMSTILSDADYNRTDESGRMQVWSRGIGYMLRYPAFGVGPHNFQTAEGTLSPFAERQQFGVGVRWNAAHNSFIQVGAELGFPGLVLFVAMLVSSLRLLRQTGQRDPTVTELDEASSYPAAALTLALIGFVVGAIFLSLAYSEMLYTLLALATGLYKVTVMMADEPPASA
jgi:O-antigen ligase